MNEPTIKQIFAELSDQLIGQKFGKIFPLAKLRIAIDFRLRDYCLSSFFGSSFCEFIK